MQASLVIPIKHLSGAKQRLAGVLSAEQRQMLFQAMVEDVLDVAATCDLIEQIVVVTSDPVVEEIAESYGARVMPEPEQAGLISAVTHAAEVLTAEQVEVMVFLPGDTPLVSVEELEVVLGGINRTDQAEFLIVPAADLGGSNCVVCSPPNCIEFGFGEDSFRRHLKLARQRGIEPAVVKLPGIGLDVDTPDDLRALVTVLLAQNIESHTYHCLLDLGLVEAGALDAHEREIEGLELERSSTSGG